MKQLLVIALASTSLMACAGKGHSKNPLKALVQATEQATEHRDLQGTFVENDCNNLSGKTAGEFVRSLTQIFKGDKTVKSTRTTFVFHGDEITKKEDHFSDTKCENTLWTVETIGSFRTETDSSKFDNLGGRALYADFKTVKATPHGAEGAKLMNDLRFCDKEQWNDGQSKEITSDAPKSSCLSTNVKVSMANYVLVRDDKTLQLGTSDIKNIGEQSRPTTPEATVYVKQ